MDMKQIVDQYKEIAGGYGKSVPLAALGISREETERAFDMLDEDYHISRFIHLQCAAGANFAINGFPQTHISIDPEIQTVL